MASTSGLRQPTRREKLRPVSIVQADSLGVIGLNCRLILHIEAGNGLLPEPFPFVVDSGASYSLISLELAQSRNLKVPPPEAEVEIPMQSVGGPEMMRVRPGRIRGWWHPERTGYPFDWPVLFRVDAPPSVPSILGLGGVVKTCHWLFDGTYAHESPYGFLTLNDIR